jgi:hypothetical protein
LRGIFAEFEAFAAVNSSAINKGNNEESRKKTRKDARYEPVRAGSKKLGQGKGKKDSQVKK